MKMGIYKKTDVCKRSTPEESTKNGLFVFPLLLVWNGLTVFLFRGLLIAEVKVAEDLILTMLVGGCVSFCYFWGVYHWMIVLQHLLGRKASRPSLPDSNANWPRVAILYCLCDNLDREAILSATKQDYDAFDVFLLDDSNTTECKQEVDRLASELGLSVFRRPDRSGYKAGNLNHAMAELNDHYPFVAINDADELLPPNFVRACINVLLSNAKLAFVQANHSDRLVDNQSAFAKQLGVMTDVRWAFYREYTNHAGVCFSLGHGLVLRTSAWREVGGYPTVVSEDIAMTLRLLATGWRGRFLSNVVCYEQFSETYSQFRRRFGRCVEADVECIRTEMPDFLRSTKPQIVEKIDALIRECRYPAKPLFLPLAFLLSVLVALDGLPVFLSHPGLTTLNACLILGPWAPYFISLEPRRFLRFLGTSVWGFASLAMVMLNAGLRSLATTPSFVVTFRRNEQNGEIAMNWHDIFCGAFAVACGFLLSSASLVLIGSALITVPLLETETWWRCDVFSVYLPILVLACCVSLSGISVAAVVLLPLVLLLY